MNKKAIILASVVAVMAAVSGCASEKPAEVGLVDHQVVVMNHPDMQEAQKVMADEYSKIQNQLMDTSSLPDAEREKKITEFRERLANLEKEKLVPVQDAADKAVNDVMTEQKLSIVLDKRSAVAGGKDITKDVLIKEGLSSDDAEKAINQAKNNFQ